MYDDDYDDYEDNLGDYYEAYLENQQVMPEEAYIDQYYYPGWEKWAGISQNTIREKTEKDIFWSAISEWRSSASIKRPVLNTSGKIYTYNLHNCPDYWWKFQKITQIEEEVIYKFLNEKRYSYDYDHVLFYKRLEKYEIRNRIIHITYFNTNIPNDFIDFRLNKDLLNSDVAFMPTIGALPEAFLEEIWKAIGQVDERWGCYSGFISDYLKKTRCNRCGFEINVQNPSVYPCRCIRCKDISDKEVINGANFS